MPASVGSRSSLLDKSVPQLVQTKLTVNEPGDRFEQEADRVADEIMRSPGLFGGAMPAGGPPDIQKKCAACASGSGICPECAEEEEKLQRKPLSSRITPLIPGQTIHSGEDEDEEKLVQGKEISGNNSNFGSKLTSSIIRT